MPPDCATIVPWIRWLNGRRTWLVIADLDGPARKYHVGDEAMFEANLMRLRHQLGADLQIAAFSNAPEFTSQRYALARTWIPPHFPGGRRATLEPLGIAIRWAALPRRHSPGPGAWLRNTDAILISGGGNLNSIYPVCLKQRLAIALAARCRRIPVLMVGQGLGPIVRRTDRWYLRMLLGLCSAIGLRDRAMSLDCLRSLGITSPSVTVHIDDAFHLPPADDDLTLSTGPNPARLWLALSIHGPDSGASGSSIDRWATLLERILERFADIGLCFLPHLVGTGPAMDDLALARLAAERMTRPCKDQLFLPHTWVPARTVRAWTARCTAVLTTRYHQAVFAAACGLPCLGLATSPYGARKLAGLCQLLGTDGAPILSIDAPPQAILDALASILPGTHRPAQPNHGRPAAEPRRLPPDLQHPLGPCSSR